MIALVGFLVGGFTCWLGMRINRWGDNIVVKEIKEETEIE